MQDFELPINVNATTSAAEAIAGAQFAIHAVPVQHTRAFLQGIKVSRRVLHHTDGSPWGAAHPARTSCALASKSGVVKPCKEVLQAVHNLNFMKMLTLM